ncbi:M48 family metallopeptidase [Andreprevotia chitinilytica]|uniref:M48 family metallopeptidase n=1 Tax=Andreprevotia chitinilytica TaxID=396808 RepID=UPI00055814DD|nr:SprT family zinc-dependent metalloprotease [Andreprevotia chitinilytica]
MQHRLELLGRRLDYTLKRSARRRSIGLKIGRDGLTVTLPVRAPVAEAERVIRLKLDWILQHLDTPRPELPQLRSGGHVLWLGTPRTLIADAARSRLDDTTLALAAPDEHDALAKAFTRFCQRAARNYFQQRVPYWAERMGLQPRRVLLTSAKSRWGSCTASGDVRLSWRLMQAPLAVIDYVIVHELAHLAELNHSPRFWAVVETICPDWKARRDWLKGEGAALLAWR